MVGSAPWSLTAGTYTEPGRRVGDEPSGIGDFEMNNYVLVSIPPSHRRVSLTPDSWGFISILTDRTRRVRDHRRRRLSAAAQNAKLAQR